MSSARRRATPGMMHVLGPAEVSVCRRGSDAINDLPCRSCVPLLAVSLRRTRPSEQADLGASHPVLTRSGEEPRRSVVVINKQGGGGGGVRVVGRWWGGEAATSGNGSTISPVAWVGSSLVVWLCAWWWALALARLHRTGLYRLGEAQWGSSSGWWLHTRE